MTKNKPQAICNKCRNFETCDWVKFAEKAKHIDFSVSSKHNCKDFIDKENTFL